MTLTCNATRVKNHADNALYSYEKADVIETSFKAVPYFAWANRGVGEMVVWICDSLPKKI